MKPKLKAALYLRFSDTSQIGNTSIEVQESMCKRVCSQENIDIVDTRKDEAVSADGSKHTDRVRDLLDYCKRWKGRIQVLMVYKTDRFARNAYQHLFLRMEMDKLGIVLRSATERLSEDSTGKFLETITAGANEWENEKRRERTISGQDARVKEGLWPWNYPLGYMKVRSSDESLKPFAVDETCAWAIIEIFKKYSTGTVTKTDLAREYSAKKIKNFKGRVIKFSVQTIHNTLANIYYAGYLDHGEDGPVKGRHKALIDLSLYNKCQQVRIKRTNNATNKRQYINPSFPLRQFVRCGYCNQPLTGAFAKKVYPHYFCRNSKCDHFRKTIRKDDLELAFKDSLAEVKPTKDFIQRFETRFINKYKDRETQIRGDYLDKIKEIEQLEAEKIVITQKSLKGVFDDETAKELLDKNKQNLNLAKFELTEIHGEELDVQALLAYANLFIRTLENTWYNAKINGKIRLQRWLFSEGVYYRFENEKIVFRTTKLNRLFELIELVGAEKSMTVTPSGFEPELPG